MPSALSGLGITSTGALNGDVLGLIKPAAVIDAMYSRKCGSKCTAVLMYCRLSGGASFLRLMSNSRSSGSSLCFTIGV